MEVEIEISEEELRTSLERHVRTLVAQQTASYLADTYIKEQVNAQWRLAVDALVAEVLYDSRALRQKISDELEKKLRAQLAAAIKNAA